MYLTLTVAIPRMLLRASPPDPPLSSVVTPLPEDGVLVPDAGGDGGVEEVPGLHPAVRPLEHLAGVGLRHDPLARPEASHVDELDEVRRHLPRPVVGVALGLEIDLLLRAQQGAEVAL